MKTRGRRLLVAVLLAALTALAGAAARGGRPDEAELAEAEFKAALGDGLAAGLPGLSAALATRQGVVWTGAVGYANLEDGSRANAAYVYGIGSITKTFVACVIEQLVDEGRLKLTDTAAAILGPEVVRGIPNADTATLAELLNHTSGVPTWEFDADWIRRGRGSELLTERPWGKAETLEYLRNGRHPATNPPGHGYAYSNSNYTLLGLVIEKVTGHDAVAEIHARLLDGRGLRSIRLEGFEPMDTRRLPARYHFDTAAFRRDAGLHASYRSVRPGLIDVSRSNLSTEWTAGGLVSSASDLAEFARALRDGEVVSAAALQRMQPTVPADDPGEQAGAGLFREPLAGGSLIGYDGGVLGFGAVMGWLEDQDLVIVVMTNAGSMHAGDGAYYPLKLVRSARFVAAARRLGHALEAKSPGVATATH
jgi:D-alanyl-D-alanine carboxypeptidase